MKSPDLAYISKSKTRSTKQTRPVPDMNHFLLVFRLLVAKLDPGAAKFPELVSDHVVRHLDGNVVLPIVHHEPQADKGGNDGATACLCPDRRPLLQSLGERGRKGDDVGTLPDGSLEQDGRGLHWF